jgi:hypothetical protein
MSPIPRLLLEPTLAELAPRERKWVQEAKELCEQDPWYETANYDPSVHPRFLGFYISRVRKQAFPVYQTDNGLVAVNYRPHEHAVESWVVSEEQVYPATLTFPSAEETTR